MFEDMSLDHHDLAWTGLNKADIDHIVKHGNNPMMERTPTDKDNMGMRELYLMSKCPEYVHFACKTLLNLEISPMQACMLYGLWAHPFPMLIGSRGLSKKIRPHEKIRVKNGWTEIQDLSVGDQVYGRDGNLCNVIDTTPISEDEFYKITLRDGRTIEACADHQWKVWDKNKNKKRPGQTREDNWTVVKTKDMVDKYYYDRKDSKSPDPNKRCKEYLYFLPIAKPLKSEEIIDKLPIHPYILGVLLGDGGITHKGSTITSADPEIIERVAKYLPKEYRIRKEKSSKYGYIIIVKPKYRGKAPAFHRILSEIGIQGHGAKTKFIPDAYKYADNETKLEVIKGLMDTDGSSAANFISFVSISDQLSTDIIDMLRSLGFYCKRAKYESWFNGDRYNDAYTVAIYTTKAVFHLKRKLGYVGRNISKQAKSKYDKVAITKIEYIGKKDGMCIQVDSPDNTYITKDYIVTHNSFSLAVYAILRGALMQGTKIVIVGASFRQSKIIHAYVNTIWKDAPVLRSIFKTDLDGTKSNSDMITFTMGRSVLYFIPLGNGQKIRGLRANIVLTDEMNSLNTDVYEIVVNNFAAVAMDPIENMKRKAKIKSLELDGMHIPEELLEDGFKNQSVIAGTMGFEFEPMFEYWKKYKHIIETKGADINKAFDGQDVDFSYKDFCIMRLPYELIPKGFMDDKTIARAKATIHAGAYASEYGCVPVKDTQGFFRRLIIEQCVANDKAVVKDEWPTWCRSSFDARISGDRNSRYVMGIDPAADQDNFAIIIIEVLPEHQRIVYSWTTNREKVRKNNPDTNYYAHCARHIRDLQVAFNITRIGIDGQGGGVPLSEALHDKELLRKGEVQLWPEIIEDSKQDTDRLAGNHILSIVQFANYKWLSNANHSLRKDLEDRTILFPRYNAILLGLAGEKAGKSNFDLEDCIINIEELKTELSTIVMTKTSLREKWDTPQVKVDSNKVGRMRKDRYSALLIANSLAREVNRDMREELVMPDVGIAVGSTGRKPNRIEPDYYGNSPLAKKISSGSYRAVGRGN